MRLRTNRRRYKIIKYTELIGVETAANRRIYAGAYAPPFGHNIVYFPSVVQNPAQRP